MPRFTCHLQDTASIPTRPAPPTDLNKFARFPATARQRELTKLVEKYSANGVHLFVHYTTPILQARRKALLASGKTRKTYHKTASQLWITLDDEQKLFWDHQAKLIRLGIVNGTLSLEECVRDAGFGDEWGKCVRFGERAVGGGGGGGYLGIEVPEGLQEVEEKVQLESVPEALAVKEPSLELSKHSTTTQESAPITETTSPALLDTLREPFTAEPRMIYGNFAQLYPYTAIHQAEGKHQIALLRQLADLLDPTGKEFFYYYATPHLWKSIRPTDVDETIASVVHRLWMHMSGPEKRQWEVASARAKNLLGDGNLEGLEMLELERDCEEVWRLHDLTEEAVKMYSGKRWADEKVDYGLEGLRKEDEE